MQFEEIDFFGCGFSHLSARKVLVSGDVDLGFTFPATAYNLVSKILRFNPNLIVDDKFSEYLEGLLSAQNQDSDNRLVSKLKKNVQPAKSSPRKLKDWQRDFIESRFKIQEDRIGPCDVDLTKARIEASLLLDNCLLVARVRDDKMRGHAALRLESAYIAKDVVVSHFTRTKQDDLTIKEGNSGIFIGVFSARNLYVGGDFWGGGGIYTTCYGNESDDDAIFMQGATINGNLYFLSRKENQTFLAGCLNLLSCTIKNTLQIKDLDVTIPNDEQFNKNPPRVLYADALRVGSHAVISISGIHENKTHKNAQLSCSGMQVEGEISLTCEHPYIFNLFNLKASGDIKIRLTHNFADYSSDNKALILGNTHCKGNVDLIITQKSTLLCRPVTSKETSSLSLDLSGLVTSGDFHLSGDIRSDIKAVLMHIGGTLRLYPTFYDCSMDISGSRIKGHLYLSQDIESEYQSKNFLFAKSGNTGETSATVVNSLLNNPQFLDTAKQALECVTFVCSNSKAQRLNTHFLSMDIEQMNGECLNNPPASLIMKHVMVAQSLRVHRIKILEKQEPGRADINDWRGRAKNVKRLLLIWLRKHFEYFKYPSKNLDKDRNKEEGSSGIVENQDSNKKESATLACEDILVEEHSLGFTDSWKYLTVLLKPHRFKHFLAYDVLSDGKRDVFIDNDFENVKAVVNEDSFGFKTLFEDTSIKLNQPVRCKELKSKLHSYLTMYGRVIKASAYGKYPPTIKKPFIFPPWNDNQISITPVNAVSQTDATHASHFIVNCPTLFDGKRYDSVYAIGKSGRVTLEYAKESKSINKQSNMQTESFEPSYLHYGSRYFIASGQGKEKQEATADNQWKEKVVTEASRRGDLNGNRLNCNPLLRFFLHVGKDSFAFLKLSKLVYMILYSGGGRYRRFMNKFYLFSPSVLPVIDLRGMHVGTLNDRRGNGWRNPEESVHSSLWLNFKLFLRLDGFVFNRLMYVSEKHRLIGENKKLEERFNSASSTADGRPNPASSNDESWKSRLSWLYRQFPTGKASRTTMFNQPFTQFINTYSYRGDFANLTPILAKRFSIELDLLKKRLLTHSLVKFSWFVLAIYAVVSCAVMPAKCVGGLPLAISIAIMIGLSRHPILQIGLGTLLRFSLLLIISSLVYTVLLISGGLEFEFVQLYVLFLWQISVLTFLILCAIGRLLISLVKYTYKLCFNYALSVPRAVVTIIFLVCVGSYATDRANKEGYLVIDANFTATLLDSNGQPQMRQGVENGEPQLESNATINQALIGETARCGNTIDHFMYASDMFFPLIDFRQEFRCHIRSPLAWESSLQLLKVYQASSWEERFEYIFNGLTSTHPEKWIWLKGLYTVIGWLVISLTILTITRVMRFHQGSKDVGS